MVKTLLAYGDLDMLLWKWWMMFVCFVLLWGKKPRGIVFGIKVVDGIMKTATLRFAQKKTTPQS